MFFPWNNYKEKALAIRNTIQIFITKQCNLNCNGCFARNIMRQGQTHITSDEYIKVFETIPDIQQVNLLGGEPLCHPQLEEFLDINRYYGLKTTIYTNGLLIDTIKNTANLENVKFRISIYGFNGHKGVTSIIKVPFRIDPNFMVSSSTTLDELLNCAYYIEKEFNCKIFFISSLRELDNCRQEFFDDTDLTMPVLKYKELVHNFLKEYKGNLEIHVSKRGVFESTVSLPVNKCRFVNYFPDGKIIQCPYDIVNSKFQQTAEFNTRYCQHNNSCLMSKVIYIHK